ncbi:MAG: tRNA (adenosine(37)-N6)-dimethylallyltransferase MiaA [Bacteroidetes bacterium]|nr:tRNA (adenosine(37)-N6)-dimethylallyltransferase MiaA [Bacteroidota bacterium]
MSELITILGPTATGKTSLAAAVAIRIGAEVISADSRQVYRGMDMGTGKDLEDYIVEGKKVPYHLIDIADPGEEYNVYSFQGDFLNAYQDIIDRDMKAIMCGGTGMYLESVLLAYELIETPVDKELRQELENFETEELINRLLALRDIHNVTDTSDRKRLIRAIEIEEGKGHMARGIWPKGKGKMEFPDLKHHVFGISLPREEVRKRITQRLKQRLDEGMVDEVKNLLDSGVSAEQLEFYGLEYKYLTQYVRGKIDYNEMFQKLNTAIHQFAKRQMTWFRRMEKRGVPIRWVDGTLSLEDKIREFRVPGNRLRESEN